MSKKKQKGAGFYLLYALANLHAMLPFRVLYILSDILYLIVYRLVGYRKRVVRKNIRNAFPQSAPQQWRKIEKRFYRHLCDYFVETIKTLRISDREARRRMVFKNPEVVNNLTRDGNSCLLSLGHYGNWEWVPSIGMYLLPGVEQGQIYKTLTSPAFDQLFLKIRSRFSPKSIEMKGAYRTIIAKRNEGKAMVIGFLTDQRPRKEQTQYVTTFLNQQTGLQTGMERIAGQFGFAVVYLDIKKVKRGHYEGEFSVITSDASKEKPGAVMEAYARHLEKTILYEPAYYLWSHDRWKFNQNPRQA